MNPPTNWTQVIDGKRYNTGTATLIADDCYWDGNNWERGGRNSFLYRTVKGNYFAAHLTQWQGERDHLVPLTPEEARDLYESLPEKREELDEAFPGTVIEEA